MQNFVFLRSVSIFPEFISFLYLKKSLEKEKGFFFLRGPLSPCRPSPQNKANLRPFSLSTCHCKWARHPCGPPTGLSLSLSGARVGGGGFFPKAQHAPLLWPSLHQCDFGRYAGQSPRYCATALASCAPAASSRHVPPRAAVRSHHTALHCVSATLLLPAMMLNAGLLMPCRSMLSLTPSPAGTARMHQLGRCLAT
jgi:hypothetical protein